MGVDFFYVLNHTVFSYVYHNYLNQPNWRTTIMMFSCLQGYALTTYDELVNALGEPDYKREGTYSRPTVNDGDGKVSVEWMTDDFTVYDWKLDDTPMNEHHWHIGGMNQKALQKFEATTGIKTKGH